jgi:tryptophan halogenase
MNIVIIGGGTAGWLAAVMISKTQPIHSITVIESSKIGIVGAGEGSTGALTSIIQGTTWDYGLDEKEFFSKTNATVKLGIKHKDWKTVGHQYIAPIDSPINNNNFGINPVFAHCIANNLPFHTSSMNGYFIEKNLSSFSTYRDTYVSNYTHSYHFDAHLVSKYFKEKCKKSVNYIDSVVKNVNVNVNGDIESVTLENDFDVKGDFFIDASGFSRLLAKKLNIKWESYDKNLPVNTAMPFLIEHKEYEKIEPVTTAWAQKNGWMWMIPTQGRYGCGYVFDNRYTSNEDAQKEIENTLGHEISPIKFLNFESGRSEVLWKNNCLLIGLSSAFLEPLEATSIHSTIIQLTNFIFNYLKDDKNTTCNLGSINLYNKKTIQMYEDYKDFISLHYASSRKDSQFWIDISKTEKRTNNAASIIETAKSRIINDEDFIQYLGYIGSPLYNWILAGLGHLTSETAKKELKFYGHDQTFNLYEEHLSFMKNLCYSGLENNELLSIIRSEKL